MNQPIDNKAVETITITVEEHEELVAAQNFLETLQGCGVDNWAGYEMAQEMMSGEEKEI